MADHNPMSLNDIKAKLQALGDSASMALYRVAKSIDRHQGDNSESINGNEWSIFEEQAKNMVRNNNATVKEYESIFGAGSYKEEEPSKPAAPTTPTPRPTAPVDSTRVDHLRQDSLRQDTIRYQERLNRAAYTPTPRPSGDKANQAGAELYDILKGNTDDSLYPRVNEIIDMSHLDENNVMQILDGFYEQKNATDLIPDDEGIIEMLDDENDGKAIKMENKKNIIASLIDCAKKNGLEGDRDLHALQLILDTYNTTPLSTKDDFNNNGWTRFNLGRAGSIATSTGAGAAIGGVVGACFGAGIASWLTGPVGAWIGAGVGAVAGFCDRVTDNEVIDDLMKKIYDKIKARQAGH